MTKSPTALMRPQLRFLIAPVRSGTTAFMHTMAQHSELDTATFVMKRHLSDQAAHCRVDYGVYDVMSSKQFLVYKATFGCENPLLCCYPPFRTDSDIARTKPLFLFRDPVQTFNSWKRRKWGDVHLFSLAYHHVYNLYRYACAVSSKCLAITYEQLSTASSTVLPQIFQYWNVPYRPDLLTWQTPLGEATYKASAALGDEIRARFANDRRCGHYDSIMTGEQRYRFQENELILTDNEIQIIERTNRPIYLGVSHLSACSLSLPSAKDGA